MGIDDNDKFDEEPSPAEIADAFRNLLDKETCDEISRQAETEYAYALAFTASTDAGEQHPEKYLMAAGISHSNFPNYITPIP
jgi:hypothetical protein